MILDDLLFIIQIKERNFTESKTNTDNWFKNKVLKKGKEQIRDTLEYLISYDEILIKNRRNQTINITKINTTEINKIIIYHADEKLKKEYKFMKFYESSINGNIHIFNIEDYHWICKYLITPTELDEYLKFRERIYFKHKLLMNNCPEQYLLGHFLNTEDVSFIKPEYIHTLTNLKEDVDEFDMSNFLDAFSNNIIRSEHKESIEYHSIIKQISKLKRYELLEFKTRFLKTIEDCKLEERKLPYRFASLRTSCGFVFIPVNKVDHKKWEIMLKNITELFKYKHRLQNCIGITISKKGEFIDINWGLISFEWESNSELEELIKKEKKLLGAPEYKELERYKKKNN
ncbi:hypothetical protein ACYE2N_02320 [Flavobacterium sp. MAHUQ-51]|uniref:hypothetical protein n=1 Tax=Flavobacterium sp. GCM10022190 TaxID=3252639 RepID=UPI003614F39F